MVETGHHGAINSFEGEEEFSRVQKAFFFCNHSSCQPNISSCVAIPSLLSMSLSLVMAGWRWGEGDVMSQENSLLYFLFSEQRSKVPR